LNQSELSETNLLAAVLLFLQTTFSLVNNINKSAATIQ